MDNKLDIRREVSGSEHEIFLEGRLDANWAGHLDDYLNNLVREGSYRFKINMFGVQYLSSAGIRILVNQYKNIKKLGGLFVLESLSPQVSEVLSMVGMINILTQAANEVKPVEKEESLVAEIYGYRFDNKILSDKSMVFKALGQPGLSIKSGFTSSDNVKIRFGTGLYGIGIGAIGEGFDDCKNRYGEYMGIGEALVYKPSDGSKLPDYALKTGRLEPEIDSVVSLLAEGTFSNRITFDSKDVDTSLSLGDMVSGFANISGHKRFMFLTIAESAGLVGVSLSSSPTSGKNIFQFPEIRETVNFTTEPSWPRMLTVLLGFYLDRPEEKALPFLRQVSPGSSAFIHTHSAVFPFQALPKNETSPGKLVMHLFESSIVQDVMHLINDSREIAGLGESTFRQGVAWIGKLS